MGVKRQKEANKMKNTTVLNEANKILISLEKLQQRATKLVKKAEDSKPYYPPHIARVLETLEDLASFDLEDCLVSAYDYE